MYWRLMSRIISMYFYPLTSAIILIMTVMLPVLHGHRIHRQFMHELQFSGDVRLRDLMLLIAGTSTEIDTTHAPNRHRYVRSSLTATPQRSWLRWSARRACSLADDCYSQCAAEVLGGYSSDSRAGEISLCSTGIRMGRSQRKYRLIDSRKACSRCVNSTRRICRKQDLTREETESLCRGAEKV